MTVDVSQKAYFLEILPENHKINISNICYTENEENPVFIISIPYFKDGKFKGAVAASIEVKALTKIKDKIKISDKYELYLLDREGHFLVHPDGNYIGRMYTPSEYFYKNISSDYVFSSNEGFVETKNEKDEKIDLFYKKIPNSGWSIALAFPRYSLEKIYNQENIERLSILAITLFSIVFLLYFQNKIINYFYRKKAIKIDYDSFTNLLTREKFEDVAAKIIKRNTGKKFMLIESDISGFKFVNQNYGEADADKLIYYFSTLINNFSTKYKGITGHGYADRFYSLMKIKSVNSSMTEFKAFLNTLLNEVKNYEIPFSPKFGITFFRSDSKKEISVRELIGQASFSKSSIKDNMLVHYAIYNSRVVKKMNELRFIESSAENALENGEFYVLYQPKIFLLNDKIAGAEALVRWKTQEGKFYTPDKFIPLFEQNGFITKLDFYVYEAVFKFLDKQLKTGGKVVPVSVNMSRNHNRPEKFVTEFMNIFKKYDIPPSLIQVEIIERSVMDDNTLREITERLHNNGFTVAMDDFGSGESSLNMLTKVPVDVLKFDREFLISSTNEDGTLTEKSSIFIRSLLDLSKHLEKETVFEGVETELQRDFLKNASCDQVQGYFYSKPLSEQDFIEFINNHS